MFLAIFSAEHFTALEVQHPTNNAKLAGTLEKSAITVSDSNTSNEQIAFVGKTHDALRFAFTAMGLLEKVDFFGCALPQQHTNDCGFCVVTYLATRLTGDFLNPVLWKTFTRLLRCWTVLQLNRTLCQDNAIQDVLPAVKQSWAQRSVRTQPAALTSLEEQTTGSDLIGDPPQRKELPSTMTPLEEEWLKNNMSSCPCVRSKLPLP